MASQEAGSGSRVSVTLARNDLGQLLDGLEVLIEQWDSTYRFHAYGEIEEDGVLRECSSAEEAQAIRDHYRRIADEVYGQVGG